MVFMAIFYEGNKVYRAVKYKGHTQAEDFIRAVGDHEAGYDHYFMGIPESVYEEYLESEGLTCDRNFEYFDLTMIL